MSIAKLRHFFGLCEYEYFAGYYRKCTECGDIRAGWGAKKLNPGDDFDTLYDLNPHLKVDPDYFRKVQLPIEK